jgi:hypothetical protein
LAARVWRVGVRAVVIVTALSPPARGRQAALEVREYPVPAGGGKVWGAESGVDELVVVRTR